MPIEHDHGAIQKILQVLASRRWCSLAGHLYQSMLAYHPTDRCSAAPAKRFLERYLVCPYQLSCTTCRQCPCCQGACMAKHQGRQAYDKLTHANPGLVSGSELAIMQRNGVSASCKVSNQPLMCANNKMMGSEGVIVLDEKLRDPQGTCRSPCHSPRCASYCQTGSVFQTGYL